MSYVKDQMARLRHFFPFLSWFPVSSVLLRSDLIAGITGALVLVPKAMAYAQLSGLPVHFGLYVAFVPAILGALWGSSRQLATGPVAIVSLMTAAALTPLAAPLSVEYIELALLLTLMVGIIQFALGALKLGTIVNFVSHPVILGFMNAAAVIIALSQLDMLLGIPKGRSGSFLLDIWEMLGYLQQTHLPTLAMAVFALALMLVLKKIALVSKMSVLIAVVVTIIVSHALDFERNDQGRIDHIADTATRELVSAYAQADKRVRELTANATTQTAQLRATESVDARAAAVLRHQMHLSQLDAADLAAENKDRQRDISRLAFERARASQDGAATLHLAAQVPAGVKTDGHQWRIKKIEEGKLSLVGGGDVVGNIPQGLPALRVPTISLGALLSLLSAAMVIALVAFMESIAMAKALAAKTKQRIDPNQELIGQGVANIGGAFFQSYPACGSFTGSAINLQAGAKTGFAMVFNGLFVVTTLLFLTPYLYHLPKATLGVIILLAVTSLITPKALKHTWQASRTDGMVALTTFVVTLLAAPHLDKGILVGAALAIVLFLYRTMKPRVAQLGRHPDGALRDVLFHPQLPTSENVIALRFDAALYFANASFFEEAVLGAVADKPQLRYLLVVGNGINQMDASGEEVVHHLVERLRDSGVTLVFSGLKKQVLDVMRRTGLFELIGAEHVFPSADQALIAIYRWLGPEGKGELLTPPAPGTRSRTAP
nr:SulP family inorganic anion transporter [Rhodoferax sp.]